MYEMACIFLIIISQNICFGYILSVKLVTFLSEETKTDELRNVLYDI